jgi:hypothetical protein
MKDLIRMNQLAGIITEGQARKMMAILNEELDFPSEVEQYLKDNPFTSSNEFSGEFEIEFKKHIQDKLGRPLTPKEKGEVTRSYKKSLEKQWGDRWDEESNEEQEAARNRIQQNLLPLSINNAYGTPDPTYYEVANTYYDTDRDGKRWVSYNDPKSGYTEYKLKDKWIDTPVEDSVLNKFWKDKP